MGAYSQREIRDGLVPSLEQFCFKASRGPAVNWTDPRLARVVRLRLVSQDPDPVFEVLYCHGVLQDGTACRVELPFDSLSKKSCREELAHRARVAGLNAIELGLFRALSTLA